MEAPPLERKLVAILAADVEGYSRHMERDEVATLATLSGPPCDRRRADRLPQRPHHRHRRRQRAGRIPERRRCAPLRHRDAARDRRRQREPADGAPAAASASASMSATSWSRTATSSATASTSPPGSKRWPIPAASASRAACATMSARWAVRLRGSRRAERQEHRPADPRLPGAQRRCGGGASSDTIGRRPLPSQPPRGPACEQHAESISDEAEFELAFWESMKDSKDPAEFEAYLEQYPCRRFRRPGRARLPGGASGASGRPAAETGGAGLGSRRRRARLLGYGQGQRQPGNVRCLPRALPRRGLRCLGKGSPRGGRIAVPLRHWKQTMRLFKRVLVCRHNSLHGDHSRRAGVTMARLPGPALAGRDADFRLVRAVAIALLGAIAILALHFGATCSFRRRSRCFSRSSSARRHLGQAPAAASAGGRRGRDGAWSWPASSRSWCSPSLPRWRAA